MLPESPEDIAHPGDPVPPAPAPPPDDDALAADPAGDDTGAATPPQAAGAAPVRLRPVRLSLPVAPPTTTSLVLAGLFPRGLAFLVDAMILVLVESFLLIGSSAATGGVLWLALWAAYEWYFLVDRNGQTPGKMLMRIRVVKVDGSPLKTPDALLRYLGYVINSLPFVFGMGWAWAVIDSRRQGWHDKLARTLVVVVSRPGPSPDSARRG